MSVIDDQKSRFKKQRGMGAAWVRHEIANYHHGQASLAMAAGDMEGYARHMAISDAASAGTLSLSWGAPVPIESRRPDPPESPE